MKIYVTVTDLLGQHNFEMTVKKSQADLPYQEFLQAIQLHKYLDQHYPDWGGYDINLDECDFGYKAVVEENVEVDIEELPDVEEITDLEIIEEQEEEVEDQ